MSTDLRAKVRAMLDRANHPGTPQAEAEVALAMAHRMMQRHGLGPGDLGDATASPTTVTVRREEITGPYRVRRGDLFWRLAGTLSCACYRDMAAGADTVSMVAYGSEHDLDSLVVLFRAADLLALRTMPSGSRSWRTAWWHGFCEGIAERLERENRTTATERPGAGLVLADRRERAESAMHVAMPGLRSGTVRVRAERDAWEQGAASGRRFDPGGSSLRGGRGELSA